MVAARIRLVARLGGTGSRLSPFVLGSTAAHGVFLAALMLLPSLRPRKPFPDEPIVVQLVAAPRPAAQRQVEAPPPPETARLETREPPKPKPLPEEPQPVEKPKKPAEKRPPPPPPPSPRPEIDPAPGEAPGVAGEPGSSSVSLLEGGDVRFAWYRASVTTAINGQWRRPILEGLREPVQVLVRFEILRDGSIRGLRVERSSNVQVFDRSALRAVADAAPLPALPLNWRDPTLPVSLIFRLHPE